jgi:hypothetical protein
MRGIFLIILSVPHNTDVGLNNVMWLQVTASKVSWGELLKVVQDAIVHTLRKKRKEKKNYAGTWYPHECEHVVQMLNMAGPRGGKS